MENKETPTEKPQGFFRKMLTEHGTTAIAIIMTLITLQAENIDALREDADFREQQTEEKRANMEEDISEIDERISDIDLENVDTTTQEYIDEINELQQKEASLKTQEEEIEADEHAQEALLAVVEEKEEKSNWAESISQLAVLISATGASAKKRLLQYGAGGLTIASLILVLYTFIL